MNEIDPTKAAAFNESKKAIQARDALIEACTQLNLGARKAWIGLDLRESKWSAAPVSSWTPLALQAANGFHELTVQFDNDELSAFNIFQSLDPFVGKNEWLPEWAELAGPTVTRVGIPKYDTESGQTARSLMLYCPEFARLAMASKRNWDEVFSMNAPEILQGERYRQCRTGEVLARVMATAEKETGRHPSWDDHSRRRAVWAWPEIMDKAEADGLLAHLAKSPRLGIWAMRLALRGNRTRFERAMAQAPDLSWITPGASRELFTQMGQAYYPRTLSLEALHYGKAVWRKAQAEDDACKGAIWADLCTAGLPPGASQEAPNYANGSWHRLPETLLSVIEIEAERGGLLGPEAALLWGGMELELPEAKRAFYGGSPLRWAFAHGLGAKEWTTAMVQTLTARPPVNARVDALLIELDRAGVKLGVAGDSKLSRSNGGGLDPLHLTLIKAGARAEGLSAAARMGVNIFEKDRAKCPPLEALYELDRVKEQDQRLAAYLAAAEASQQGGAAALLAQRSAAGAGPMHWAARGLCAASVELLAQWGVDPMVSDAVGKTAGHWAARRYGVKFAGKIAPTLEALGAAGQDWGAVDLKGVSALAELARRGPMEPLLPIVERAPGSVFAKDKRARSAMEFLAERGERGESQGFAQVEAATLAGTLSAVAEAGAPSTPRKKRL